MVSLWKGTRSSPSKKSGLEVFKIGHGHTSPSGIPPNERREGQIVFNPSSKADQRVVIGTFLASPSRLDSLSRKSNVRVQKLLKYEMQGIPMRFPGLPLMPKNSGLALRALPRLNKREERPSRPTIGLESSTCIACATFSAVICSRPAALEGSRTIPYAQSRYSLPSTWYGWSGSLENRPDANIWVLATPRPSEREKVRPVTGSVYSQAFPAPASRSTDTTTRSNSLRACSLISGGFGTAVHIWIKGWTRSMPASRCRHRPCGSILRRVWVQKQNYVQLTRTLVKFCP